VQAFERRLIWNEDIRVVAEPLHTTIPNVTMNVVV
jgi:hypothetical protein